MSTVAAESYCGEIAIEISRRIGKEEKAGGEECGSRQAPCNSPEDSASGSIFQSPRMPIFLSDFAFLSLHKGPQSIKPCPLSHYTLFTSSCRGSGKIFRIW